MAVSTAFVIDAFSRRIVGWRVSSSLRAELALEEDMPPKRSLGLPRSSNEAALQGLLEDANVARNGVLDIRVGIIGCDCTTCKKGAYKGLWVWDELVAPHIPHAGCLRDGWCACDYVADTDSALYPLTAPCRPRRSRLWGAGQSTDRATEGAGLPAGA